MNRISVTKDVLQWALDRSGQTAAEAEEHFPRLRKWLTGEDRPTFRQLEQFAAATATPFGFLFLSQPIDEKLSIPHYRTVSNASVERPSPELLDTIQEMERRQAWLREFLTNEGEEPVPFVQSARVSEQAKSVAAKMRAAIGVDEYWAARHATWTDALGGLRDAIDAAGVVVVVNGIVGNNTHRKLDVAEFRGFVLVDAFAPLVFVNGADAKAAQMFTLAHELAHVLFGSSAAFDLRRLAPAKEPIEQACNQAAAEFLVPAERLQALWSTIRNDALPFESVARRFKVSQIVAARRALDLGLITHQDFDAFFLDYVAQEHRKTEDSEGGNFYATQNQRIGARLASAVIRAVREGKLLYADAYRLTGLRGRTFDRFAASFAERGS